MAGKQVKETPDLAALQAENKELKARIEEMSPKAVKDPNEYLPKAIQAKFEVVNWVGGSLQHFGRFGEIDLTMLSLVKAQSLVRRGFSKLRARS